MRHMLPTILILVLVFAFVASRRRWRDWAGPSRRGQSGGAYRPRQLLTENEAEFHGRLRTALPDFEILAQVAMGALIEPDGARNRSDYYRLRGPIAQKIVDFVICERGTLRPLVIVELDDRTHDAAKDAERDRILESASYRVVRWDARDKPTLAQIAAIIGDIAAP